MSFWTMVFLIVVIGIAYDMWKKKHDADQGIVRDWRGNPMTGQRDDRLISDQRDQLKQHDRAQREIRELRERVQVLERIVTDPSADLSRQIEELRALKDEPETAR